MQFALALFICYILLVVGTFMVFLFFYTDAESALSIRSLLLAGLANYAANPNWRDFIDWLQSTVGLFPLVSPAFSRLTFTCVQFHCCGATERGYRDWGDVAQFNCSTDNGLPEACGVPYSCCYKDSRAARGGVQCWRGAQRKSITELEQGRLVSTGGCLQPLQGAFERQAVLIGAVVGAVIVPVCVGVMLANVLGKQIEKQRYLLEREAKREEKRRRRAKHRFRDPFARANLTFTRRRNRSQDYLHMVDETEARELSPSHQRTPVPQELRSALFFAFFSFTLLVCLRRATHLTQELILGTASSGSSEGAPSTSATSPSPPSPPSPSAPPPSAPPSPPATDPPPAPPPAKAPTRRSTAKAPDKSDSHLPWNRSQARIWLR